MKAVALARKLSPVLPMLRCPLCGSAMELPNVMTRCEKGHCFDLSARGYLNLAPMHNQNAEKYDTMLFQSRNRIFQSGFYLPVVNAVETMLRARYGDAPFALADVGCGEGYYARLLQRRFPAGCFFGVDLSRDGIVQAARGGNPVHWLVADLTRLPFRDGALHALLNVLTPADYAEFFRVLAPQGELIKVIPGRDYLWELRAAVRDSLRSAEYDNQRVLSHLEASAEVVERLTIRETLPVDTEQAADFLRMTPMTFSIPREALASVSLTTVTVHLEVLRCRARR